VKGEAHPGNRPAKNSQRCRILTGSKNKTEYLGRKEHKIAARVQPCFLTNFSGPCSIDLLNVGGDYVGGKRGKGRGRPVR